MNVTLDWLLPVLSTPSIAAAELSTSMAAGPRLVTCTLPYTGVLASSPESSWIPLKSDSEPLSNDCTVTCRFEALLLSVEPAGVNGTFAVWPIASLAPGAATPPELEEEVVVVAAAALVVEVVALEVAGAAAPVALLDELLPPQAATPPATANAASAAPIDVPRSVPIIITPWIKLSDKLTSQDAQNKGN